MRILDNDELELVAGGKLWEFPESDPDYRPNLPKSPPSTVPGEEEAPDDTIYI